MTKATAGDTGLDAVEPDHRLDPAPARLQRAALESFASKGFHGTTTRDIAAAAGMSPAALYVHYRTKEELLHQLSRSGHERTLELVRQAAAASDDPVTQLSEVITVFVRRHADAHTIARIVNYELSALTAEHRQQIRELRHSIEDTMRQIIAEGVRRGVFTTSDPKMTALALLSLGIDVSRWYREDGEWTADDIAEHYRVLALRMVGVPTIRVRRPAHRRGR